ncbi:MAG: TRAP transporter small permease subunit [Alphaproteobacteria bacterium]|nr:TRAP transporter small permease subunit [Alphaproteobacteria bacterium]
MQFLLKVADGIDAVLGVIGRIAVWLFIVCVVVICFDVVTRKVGFQIPGMGSTRLQELEWHIHAALFSFWIGLAYVRNAHVRIDIITSSLSRRKQAIIEVLGCIFFAIPYCMVVLYYSFDFAHRSFIQNEFSDAPTGLPYRWIIKGILFLGLVLLSSAVISVLIRRVDEVWTGVRRTAPGRA